MIDLILSAIKIVVLLGILITIHELGHFIVAKLSKVKVNQFAIGFGPIILEKQGKETKYSLRLIPLGGFVSMEGEEGNSEAINSFSKAKMHKKILIVAAGAIVNIVFALLLYFIISISSGTYTSNQIDSLISGFAAEKVGIQPNDKILEIDGNKIKTKNDLDKISDDFTGEELNIKVERNKESIWYNMTPTEQKTPITGIYLDENANIVLVAPNSPVDKSGVLVNDKLVKVQNIEIDGDIYKALELIASTKPENPKLQMTVDRNGKMIDININVEFISTYYIGVVFKQAPDTVINRVMNGIMETQKFVISIGENLKDLFTGQIGIDQMTGPVGISAMVADTDGVKEFFELIALILLSLGITNLLPIPALDGGKILILIIEIIRRKPMKKETEIKIQLIGFTILISLSLYITFKDIVRIF